MKSETEVKREMDGQYGSDGQRSDGTHNTWFKTNGYPKDSFDRFGDDLSELIFGFMTLEDKLRLECVAKQWRRLVYNKQFVVELYRNAMTPKSGDGVRVRSDEQIVLILKKCPNIKKVIIGDIVGTELSLIGEHCPRLKALDIRSRSLEVSHLHDFGVKYGHRLESFQFMSIDLSSHKRLHYESHIKQFLKYCMNLKNISCDLSLIIDEDPQYLPKLKIIRKCISFSEKPLKILSDKYSQSLKSIKVSVIGLTEPQVKTCIDYICRFGSLHSLELTLNDMKLSNNEITEMLSKRLSQLKSCSLTIGNKCLISDPFVIGLSELKSLKKLKIDSKSVKPRIMLSKEWSQLRHLEITYPEIGNDFFADIHSALPKLQTLEITNTAKHLSCLIKDSTIESLQSMKFIESVVIHNDHYHHNIFGLKKEWYFGKYLYEVMAERKDIKRLNDKCGQSQRFYVQKVVLPFMNCANRGHFRRDY